MLVNFTMDHVFCALVILEWYTIEGLLIHKKQKQEKTQITDKSDKYTQFGGVQSDMPGLQQGMCGANRKKIFSAI
jgi:hypothetical protein